jgi:hypothetical protein
MNDKFPASFSAGVLIGESFQMSFADGVFLRQVIPF